MNHALVLQAPTNLGTTSPMNPLETYLKEMRDIRSTGAAVAETSFYPALSTLLNEIGKTLKPKVRCFLTIANHGAGLPDGGLFTPDQLQKTTDAPKQGQLPERGVLEVKGPADDVRKIARSEQVTRYVKEYGLVLVTNYRDFLLLGRDALGNGLPMEGFTLADSEAAFWQTAAHPQKTAKEQGERFCEYVKRVMLSVAPLSAPQDVAWFLASYARDAKARMEGVDLPALASVRDAMEEALGMKFTGDKGEHFFRSTLVQTIFYGVFSAWVLWHRERPDRADAFDWRVSAWSLRVPFISALYNQIATPNQLGPLGLVEVLDWTAAALNRVNRIAFFQKFQDEHAVQYFYEPFLEAFDPELRKALGVWYTPPEIVQYQVARVDTVLREELGLADGLADPNVVVLDPCCGTGAYLMEVFKKIAETLKTKGGDALIASDLKKAAMTRVFGFEILPSPFVVSHLQLGLMLHDLGAPLGSKDGQPERVGVYLTNSLTGWEPPTGARQHILPMPELEAERDAADGVKRDERILVVLGNPPYNAFAGVSPAEEKGLVEPYKEGLNDPVKDGGWGIKKFNLDDLYIRFFRLAERRIAEMTGKGVVSFISNGSWVSEPSFVVLRKRLLENFDKIWIENLHGNRKISEYAPDGRTSETIFAIAGFSPGIQQGVATSLWVKTGHVNQTATVFYRDDIDAARANDRRAQLLASLKRKRFTAAYKKFSPLPGNRFSFRPANVADDYLEWPSVSSLWAFPPSNGLMEKRGGSLIDVDEKELAERIRDYFDPNLDWEQYAASHKAMTKPRAGFSPKAARNKALTRERFQYDRVVRYGVRPLDVRWCYYTRINPLWNRARPSLWAQHWSGNSFLVARFRSTACPEGRPFGFARHLIDDHYLTPDAVAIPLRIRNGDRLKRAQEATLFADLAGQREERTIANLSKPAREYLAGLCFKEPDGDAQAAGLIWMHALAVGYSPTYLAENADGIRRDWPRVPLPGGRKALESSAALGRQIAALLDTEADVPGVTASPVEAIFRTIGVLSRTGGGSLNADADDLGVTAGWGHAGKGGVTMPGKGRIVQRPYNKAELDAMADAAKVRGLSVKDALALLGEDTRDVYLNDKAYWRNVPAGVWEYFIGGYQVIKKWLSYREGELLGRPLTADEAREVTGMTRRLAAIVLLQPALDENYRSVAKAAYAWPGAGRQN